MKDAETGIRLSEQGKLHCDGLAISSICDTLIDHKKVTEKDPFVVYSMAAITRNCMEFDASRDLGQHLLFDVGTNPSLEVLMHLASLGVHATLSSVHHFGLVYNAGFKCEVCVVDGTANMEQSALQEAIAANMTFKVLIEF